MDSRRGLSSLLAILFSLALHSAVHGIPEDAFPGWKGESHFVNNEARQAVMSSKDPADELEELRKTRDTGIDPFKVTQISWEPRAFIYSGFLTPEECDHLVSLAKPKVHRSAVTDNDSGKSHLSEIRTSSGTFLNKYQDEVVKRVEERIAHWTFLPPENGEAIQVLRYENGQKYDAHYDYFHDKINSAMGGHRYATVLMYLSDVEEGGETVFPSGKIPDGYPRGGLSSCAMAGVAVKPRKGDALLFYSLHLDGTIDEHSLHAGCPVIKGEKWSATKWIHVNSFEPRTVPSGCADQHPNCAEWAAMGECKKNPVYMTGDNGQGGNCRKSCKAC